MTGPVDSGRLPRCWHCQTIHGSVSNLLDQRKVELPQADDVVMCTHCGALSLFTGNGLELRRPTHAEHQELMATPDVIDVVTSWMREHNRG